MEDEKVVVSEEKTKSNTELPAARPKRGVKMCYFYNKPDHIQIKCDEFRKRKKFYNLRGRKPK